MRIVPASAVVVALAVAPAGCVISGQIKPTVSQPAAARIERLWLEPVDIETRDLYYGPGGERLMPDSSAPFAFIRADASGYSPGYDVRDADGLEWSVKLGPESQPEVAVSRILWALGYHQPPTYHLNSWSMTGGQSGPQQPARFRPRLPEWKAAGEWSWYENDFIHTRPFKGLVVANLMLNNWDWKTSNNRIYELAGEGDAVRQVFVVQDVGASLGKTSYPKLLAWLPSRGLGQGSRNDLEGFESQGFIKAVEGDRVEFYYRGIYQSLLDLLTAQDVIWTCELMSQLSDEQWHDAFRAAGYSDEHARRFVAKIKSKVEEGLRLVRH